MSRDPLVSDGDRAVYLGDVPAMTRRLKSTPSPYEGWDSMPGQPKTCYLCGEPVRLKGKSPGGDGVGFRTSEPKQSWHFSCLMARRSV